MTTKRLHTRQARWAEFLSEFHIAILYRPGVANVRADALTRRSQDKSSSDDYSNRDRVLIPVERLSVASTFIMDTPAPWARMDQAADNNSLYRKAREFLHGGEASTATTKFIRTNHITRENSSIQGSLLRVRDRAWVPADNALRLQIIEDHHSTPLDGHTGASKTLELVKRSYWWPAVATSIARYVYDCQACRSSKASRLPCQGLLRPMPVATVPWKEIGMDFAVDLPTSKSQAGVEHNNILAIQTGARKCSC